MANTSHTAEDYENLKRAFHILFLSVILLTVLSLIGMIVVYDYSHAAERSRHAHDYANGFIEGTRVGEENYIKKLEKAQATKDYLTCLQAEVKKENSK